MYTAILVLFFAVGHVALELHPSEIAVDVAQCEAQLDLLQERVANATWIMHQHGLILDQKRLCVQVGEPA